MSITRITITHIASGQPRAYADSRTINRVMFEKTPSMWAPYSITSVDPKDIPWEPWELTNPETLLRSYGGLMSTPWQKDVTHGLLPYIDYIKPIDPKIIGGKEYSATWEYRIISPFTD